DLDTMRADLTREPATPATSYMDSDVRPSSLAVIGLGAIGGSLAWQARLAGVARVTGYSPSRADGVDALRASAVTELADNPARAIAGAEVVVLAVPAAATLELIDRLRP